MAGEKNWREITNDQNIRLAQKMLDQQGEIADLESQVRLLEFRRDEVLRLLEVNGASEAVSTWIYEEIRKIYEV